MPQVILPRLGILAFMDDDSRGQLAGYGHLVSTEPGQVILKEGDPSTILYVVLSGAFEITVNVPGHVVHLDSVGAGDCLGEISVFQPGTASATVTSTGAGKLWFIEAEPLQQFLIESPYFGCALILGIDTLLSRRLKRANAVIKANEIVPGFLSVRSKKRPQGVASENTK